MTVEGGDATRPAGAETSPAARAFLLGLFGLMLFCAPTLLFSRFFPTPLGIGISQAAGAAVGACAAWMARDGGAISPANPNIANQPRAAWLMKSVWIRAPVFGLLAYFTAFVAVEGGVLAMFTAVAGQPSSRTVGVVGLGGGGRNCRRFEVRELAILASRALCVSDGDLAEPVEGRSLTLYGRGSALGLNVERHELGPPQQRWR